VEYKVIVNPAAGKGKAGKQIAYVKELLGAAGIAYELELTKRAGHAAELAAKAVQEGWPAVVAMGGDGTINEVVTGLAGFDTPLGVIPLGTGNDYARSLQLPRTLPEAIKVLAQPEVTLMDMGEDQGNYFLCIAGIGFPADVMYNVNEEKSIFGGPPAIVWGIIKTLRDLRDMPLTLELDGRVLSVNAQGVFILNTVYAGGGFRFSPEASYSDGMLDVLLMRDMSRMEVLGLLPRVYAGTHLTHAKVDFFRVRQVNIFPESPVRKMVDGNIVGTTPIKARVYPKKLRVLI